MKHMARGAVAGCALLLVPVGIGTRASPRAEAVDRLARVVPIAAGASIQIDATIADLTITGSDRSDVHIEIVRRAPQSSDLALFPTMIDTEPGGLHVSVVQAEDARDARLEATIAIEMPAAASLQPVRIFEGRVRLNNLKTACDVVLERGPIEGVGLAGRIRLESGVGSVTVRDSDLTPGGMMHLRVFNGPLRVRFARQPASARILALTLNGTITSDIPLTTKDRWGPRFGETTLGSGDPVLSLDVVKGDIEIAVPHR